MSALYYHTAQFIVLEVVMEKNNRTALRISLVVIMTAIVAVFTYGFGVLRLPSPVGGYISLCDAAVTFVAYAFGPFTGFIAGGLGAAFADLIGGFPQWALISFIVHGVEALLMGLVIRKNSTSMGLKIIAALIAIVVVAGGYLLLTTLSGLTVFQEALLEVPGNILQSGVGAVIGLVLYSAVRKGYRNLDDIRW